MMMGIGAFAASNVLSALQAAAGSPAPLPAEPPIGGVVWTVVIPAILLLGSFLATFYLYRRFAKEEGAG
ncbi:hypothetical protein ACFL3Z_00305 [Gemmatimonadota bacterium]